MKIEYDGVRLDEEFDVFVTDRPLPEYKASGTNIYGVDGEDFGNLTVGTRKVELTFVLHDKRKRGLQRDARRLAEILGTRGEHKLKIGDERDKDGNQLRRIVTPIGTPELREYRNDLIQVVKFKQFDPFLYGIGQVKKLSHNMWRSFETGGNVEAWPIIKAKPVSNTFTIEKFGGEHITFKGDITGKKLIINTQRQIVKVEPDITTGEGLQLGSRFFSIEGGVTMRTNAMEAYVSWDERWL